MPKSKILIVDDNVDLLELLAVNLKKYDFSIITASSAKMGLEMARREKPNFIITDIAMPQMDGYQFSKELKRDSATAKIPIILATGKELTPEGITKRCRDLGIDDYIFKPFDIKALVGKIKKVLKIR